MPGLEVESLGGKGRFRKDKIAEQVFFQGLDHQQQQIRFPDAGIDRHLSCRPAAEAAGRGFLGVDQDRQDAGLTA